MDPFPQSDSQSAPAQPQQPVAQTCALCGRLIIPGQRTCACGAVVPAQAPASSRDYGRFLPWIPLVGFGVAVWWIISPGMLYYSMMPMLKLYACVAIASAVLAMFTAQHLQRSPNDLTPVNWFALVLVGWPVTLPWFLLTMYRDADPRRMKFGWTTAGLFIAAMFILWLIVRKPPTSWPGSPKASAQDAATSAPSASAPPSAAPGSTGAPAASSAPTGSSPTAPASAPDASTGIPAAPPSSPGAVPPQRQPAAASAASRPSPGRGGTSYGAQLPPVP